VREQVGGRRESWLGGKGGGAGGYVPLSWGEGGGTGTGRVQAEAARERGAARLEVGEGKAGEWVPLVSSSSDGEGVRPARLRAGPVNGPCGGVLAGRLCQRAGLWLVFG
jgi:hypothetical protein